MTGIVTFAEKKHENRETTTVQDMNRMIAEMPQQKDVAGKQSLHFFEEAAAIARLISHYGMTQEDAAAHLGKAQSTIANKLRLLRLTEEERELIVAHHLTERHARALLRLSAPQERMLVLQQVIQQGLNVEKTEYAVEQVIGLHKRREPYRKRNRTMHNVRMLMHTINKAVESVQANGLDVRSQKIQHGDFIELRIHIPYQGYPETPMITSMRM